MRPESAAAGCEAASYRCRNTASEIPARRASNSSSTAKASAGVERSGTVGPEAMISSGSPNTSEMIRTINCPARHSRANPPPLMRLRCLRTVFNCWMLAPAPLKCRVTASLSSKRIVSTGAGSKADPPPEIRQMHRSSADRPRTRSKIRRAPSTPAFVGSFTPGGRAPCRWIRRKLRTQSSGTLTQPVTCFSSSTRSPNPASMPAAIPAPALPQPTTAMRPIRSSGTDWPATVSRPSAIRM